MCRRPCLMFAPLCCSSTTPLFPTSLFPAVVTFRVKSASSTSCTPECIAHLQLTVCPYVYNQYSLTFLPSSPLYQILVTIISTTLPHPKAQCTCAPFLPQGTQTGHVSLEKTLTGIQYTVLQLFVRFINNDISYLFEGSVPRETALLVLMIHIPKRFRLLIHHGPYCASPHDFHLIEFHWNTEGGW